MPASQSRMPGMAKSTPSSHGQRGLRGRQPVNHPSSFVRSASGKTIEYIDITETDDEEADHKRWPDGGGGGRGVAFSTGHHYGRTSDSTGLPGRLTKAPAALPATQRQAQPSGASSAPAARNGDTQRRCAGTAATSMFAVGTPSSSSSCCSSVLSSPAARAAVKRETSIATVTAWRSRMEWQPQPQPQLPPPPPRAAATRPAPPAQPTVQVIDLTLDESSSEYDSSDDDIGHDRPPQNGPEPAESASAQEGAALAGTAGVDSANKRRGCDLEPPPAGKRQRSADVPLEDPSGDRPSSAVRGVRALQIRSAGTPTSPDGRGRRSSLAAVSDHDAPAMVKLEDHGGDRPVASSMVVPGRAREEGMDKNELGEEQSAEKRSRSNKNKSRRRTALRRAVRAEILAGNIS